MAIRKLNTSFLTGTITNTQLAGSIDQSKIVSLPTTKLTGTVTNAQLAGSIDQSKLAGSIPSSKIDLSTSFNFTGTVQRAGVNLADVNEVGSVHAWHPSVAAKTTSNIATLAGGAPNVVGGRTLQANDRVLVPNQTNQAQNGIYKVDTVGTGSNGSWSRVLDADNNGELTIGSMVFDNDTKKLYFIQSFDGTIGTDNMVWAEHKEGMTPQVTEGTGDGSNLNFDLGHSAAILVAVFVGGVIQPTSIYSLAAGAGSGGVDQLQFSSGNEPPNTEPVDIVYMTRV